MDGADEHRAEVVEEVLALGLGDALVNTNFETGGGAFGVGESYDAGGRCAFLNEGGDTAGHDFGFARTGTSNDLQMTATMPNCLFLLIAEFHDIS